MSEETTTPDLHASLVQALELTLKLTQATRALGVTLGETIKDFDRRLTDVEQRLDVNEALSDPNWQKFVENVEGA